MRCPSCGFDLTDIHDGKSSVTHPRLRNTPTEGKDDMAEMDAQQLDTLLRSIGALEPLIREHADEAERNGRLSETVVAALAEAGVFRMFIPRSLGGLEVSP